MILDREALSAMLLQAAKLLEENTQYLSDIDSRFGDGDHGITMGKIAKLIQERVPQWGEDSIKDFLDSLGMAVMEVKGGSAGPLYGTMIGGLGVNLDDDAGQVDEAGLKAMFAGCLSEMEDITTAKVGDKTMMDALIPAVEAIQACPSDDIKEILEAGAKAALAGAASTVEMKANFGRARNYGERSVGYADSGATSWSCMFESFAQAL